MNWLDNNFLVFILIALSIIVDTIMIVSITNLTSIQKERKIAFDATSKKIEEELKEIRCELKEKHQKSDLSFNLVNDFKKKLIYLMEEEKPYRDANLKLMDLASKLGISEHQTSQIINQKFGKSFCSFINMYRITEAIKIFKYGTCSNIYDTLFDVGFNNKETFDEAFKNYTLKTPIEFNTENIAMMNFKFTPS